MSLAVFARAPNSFKDPLMNSKVIWRTRTHHSALISSFHRSGGMQGKQMWAARYTFKIISRLRSTRQRDYTDGQLPELIDVIIKGKASLFVCAIGVPPKWAVDKLHAAGIPVMKCVI